MDTMDEQRETLQIYMDEETRYELRSHDGEIFVELHKRLQGILDQAPSDASAEFQVRRKSGELKGFLKIHARQRRFIGQGTGQTATDLIESIVADVSSQLVEWRGQRDVSSGGVLDTNIN